MQIGYEAPALPRVYYTVTLIDGSTHQHWIHLPRRRWNEQGKACRNDARRMYCDKVAGVAITGMKAPE